MQETAPTNMRYVRTYNFAWHCCSTLMFLLILAIIQMSVVEEADERNNKDRKVRMDECHGDGL